MALAAMASVRTAPAVGVSAGERVVTTDFQLSDVLGSSPSNAPACSSVILDTKEVVTGELTVGWSGCGDGADRRRGDGHRYARTAALAEVVLA